MNVIRFPVERRTETWREDETQPFHGQISSRAVAVGECACGREAVVSRFDKHENAWLGVCEKCLGCSAKRVTNILRRNRWSY